MGSDMVDATLKDILEELKAQRSKKKDGWDRLSSISTFLSTVVLGGLGLWFTHTYNEHQSERELSSGQEQVRVLEMQTVEKFIPHLITSDETEKEVALLAITSLGSPKFATKFVKLSPSKGAQAAGDAIMASATSAGQSTVPAAIIAKSTASTSSNQQKTGWVYLGHYVVSEKRWQTWYFNVFPNVSPSTLVSKAISVRTETGAINVRDEMPSLDGEFGSVHEVLKPSSEVTVQEIREWYDTGYMWARITYGA
jgi:cytoskeletal protein RodZ